MPPAVPPAPPFALATPSFRFRMLAALAARTPIGPAREVALAWFVCARLVEAVTGAARVGGAARAARAAAARTWLSGAGIPAPCRIPMTRLVDACADDGDVDHTRLAQAVATALAATTGHLDPAARAEVAQLTKS